MPISSGSNSKTQSEKTWKLEGRMRVGDSVNDEWCVVWLMRELSKSLDIVVSVFDSDGEFLLIEAAEALPAWVSPNNSENRVWLYNSHLHLVPIFYGSSPNIPRVRRHLPGADDDDMEESALSAADDDYLGPADAVRLVRDPSVDTIAPDEVEAVVWERLSVYPEAALQHTHRCRAYIPRDIALALSSDLSLIQRAVETFYTRDAVQLRAAHMMSRFPPSTSILATVQMTRPAYAQLVGQNFHPPKIFGRWAEREGTPEWKRKNIGMKIACGFEMLYAETKNKGQPQDAAAAGQSIKALKNSLKEDKDYQQYIQSLQRTTFFRGELEGSARWNELEAQAAQTWLDIRRVDNATRKSFAKSVNDAIASTQSTIDTPTDDAFDIGEDSDDWLDVDADMIDGMLKARSEPTSSKKAIESAGTAGNTSVDAVVDVDEDEEMTSGQAARLQKLAGKVEAFVDGEGDLEGAKFDDDLLSDEEFSDSEEDSDTSSESNEESDPDGAEMQQRKKEAAAKLVPALPAEEYGVVPASYSKSQPITVPTIATETTAALHDPETQRPVRRPILMRDKYDGVDSDDESDPEEDLLSGAGLAGDDEESDEDRPTVVGEIEVDMEAEEEEFLRFSREALGITEDQWNDILQDRSNRGAFVPTSAGALPSGPGQVNEHTASPKKTKTPSTKVASSETSPPGPNPDLDSFEAVMAAMDEALRSQKGTKGKPPTPSSNATRDTKGKGKAKAVPATMMNDITEEDADIEEAMAAELKAALASTGSDEEGDEEEVDIDYNLIKNFLQSFKAQDGLAGPVSSLAGRLEGGAWSLPRDTS